MPSPQDQILQVTIELMRPGDLSGQLLSKLTSYLAVFDDSHAETIHLPFDHRDLVHHLQPLSQSLLKGERESALSHIGRRVREFMEKLSLLPGTLRTHTDSNRPVHLRLALSGNELALIPYEAGHGPIPPFAESEPLLSNPSRQVVLTRELRHSHTMSFDWTRPPKVLLVGANPQPFPEVPLRAHALSLYQALLPFEYRRSQHEFAGRSADSMLHILPRATLDEIHRACAAASPSFTHVVILAHGVMLRGQGTESYGVAFHDQHGAAHHVSADQLRLALCPRQSDGRVAAPPTMLVMLTCHSGTQGDVVLPVGSMAHELHAAGIPWVLASQFPLSMAGSVTISTELFPSLFLGDDPRLLLDKVRQSLRLRSDHHDWASLVAYAAIPPDFDRQIQLARRRAADLACSVLFNEIDTATESSNGSPPAGDTRQSSPDQRTKYESLVSEYTQRILDTQPRHDITTTAADRAEVYGMLGAIERNRAFLLDFRDDNSAEAKHKLRQRLASARDYYAKARTLWSEFSWNTVHYLSLCALLDGKFSLTVWTAAFEVAREQTQSQVAATRAWGHAALHELFLLALSLPQKQRQILASLAGGVAPEFLHKQAIKHFNTTKAQNLPNSEVTRKMERQLRRYQLTVHARLWTPSAEFQALVQKLALRNPA